MVHGVMSAAFDLSGRTAVVTGANTGLGQGIAVALAQAGAGIVAVGRSGMEETAALCAPHGTPFRAIRADLSSLDPIPALVAQAGRVDILVNNAGIGALSSALEMSDDEWRRVIDVNTNAVFWCARAFGRHMVARRSGSIVNIGSMSGLIVNRGFAASHYMVSKAGVHQITKALAVEWAEQGVRVNAVAPGYTATSQTELLRSRPELREACLSTTPIGRFADPVEIASAVLFLAADAASYCTGTILTVDGGHTCW